MQYARDVVAGIRHILEAKLADAESARDAGMGGSVGELFAQVNGTVGRSARAVNKSADAIRDAINAKLHSARQEVRSLGGELPLLTDDIIAVNQLGAHDVIAHENIILPALRQQEEEASAELARLDGSDDQGDVGTAGPTSPLSPPPPSDPLTPWLPLNPDDVPLEPWGRSPPPPPVGTAGPVCPFGDGPGYDPRLPPHPFYLPDDPGGSSPPANPRTGSSFLLGRWWWNQPSACWQWRDGPSGPVSPPPPAAPPPPRSPPPPASPPPPPAADCCPTGAQLVIRIPGCPDLPVGGPGGPSEPRSPPVEPGSPPPPKGPPPPPKSPPPPPLPGAPEPFGSYDGPNLCVELRKPVTGNDVAPASNIVGNVIDAAAHSITTIAGGGILSEWAKSLVVGAAGVFKNVWGWAETVVHNTARGAETDDAAAMGAAQAWVGTGTVLGFFSRWLGSPVDYFGLPAEQNAKYWTPLNILSQGETDGTYLTGGLTREVWECITRMNGNRPWMHYQAMYSKRAQISPDEAVGLYMRRLLTRAELDAKLRGMGFIDPADIDAKVRLTEYVPSTPDLFRWITKDVYDDQFAAFAGLDEDFPTNLPPAFNRWFAANGTTTDQIKYDYRSQWRLPSTTQLGEMGARLRPGRVPKEVETSIDDIMRLMKLDEWPKGMRERILWTLSQPINRTDLMAAYLAGTMDEREIVERLMDLKYTAHDATALKDMLVAKGESQLQQSIGGWTKRSIVRHYIDGNITRDVADELLGRTLTDAARRTQALNDADALRFALALKECVKGLRRRYMVGEFTTFQARRELIGYGLDAIQADTLTRGWECARSSRAKEPTVKMLQEWLYWGIIDATELRRRIVNLGYSEDDATRITAAGQLGDVKKKGKEQDAAERRAEADRRRREADARRRRRDAQSGS